MEIRKPSSQIEFALNGFVEFTASGFTPVNVVMRGGDGADFLLIGGNISTVMKPLMYGEAGNDTINGGLGHDVMVGGEGNDSLSGNQGKDLLIGGNGSDFLSGQNGDDILVASKSDYDDPAIANSRTALNDIRTVWIGAGAYNLRVASIRAGVGGTQNAKLSDTTINNDGAFDQLFGGSESDWFLLNDGDTINPTAGESFDYCS
jgi:Ca2+-binding RTX toxin-like protein